LIDSVSESSVIGHCLASTVTLLAAPVIRGESNCSFCSFLGMRLVLQNPNSAYANDQRTP
jgi:hypothetical protein